MDLLTHLKARFFDKDGNEVAASSPELAYVVRGNIRTWPKESFRREILVNGAWSPIGPQPDLRAPEPTAPPAPPVVPAPPPVEPEPVVVPPPPEPRASEPTSPETPAGVAHGGES